jgi:hypothetical protein
LCGGLQNSMDLGVTVLSVCSETCLTLSAGGSEVCDMRAEEFSQTQKEEDRLAVVLTVVQVCIVASAFWQCVVWCLYVTLW